MIDRQYRADHPFPPEGVPHRFQLIHGLPRNVRLESNWREHIVKPATREKRRVARDKASGS